MWQINQYAFVHNVYMHRMVMTAEDPCNLPSNTVDHINNYKLDNRAANLRIATMSM